MESASDISSQSVESENSSKLTNSQKPENIGAENKPSKPGNGGIGQSSRPSNSGSGRPDKPEKPTSSASHVHNWV